MSVSPIDTSDIEITPEMIEAGIADYHEWEDSLIKWNYGALVAGPFCYGHHGSEGYFKNVGFRIFTLNSKIFVDKQQASIRTLVSGKTACGCLHPLNR